MGASTQQRKESLDVELEGKSQNHGIFEAQSTTNPAGADQKLLKTCLQEELKTILINVEQLMKRWDIQNEVNKNQHPDGYWTYQGDHFLSYMNV